MIVLMKHWPYPRPAHRNCLLRQMAAGGHWKKEAILNESLITQLSGSFERRNGNHFRIGYLLLLDGYQRSNEETFPSHGFNFCSLFLFLSECDIVIGIRRNLILFFKAVFFSNLIRFYLEWKPYSVWWFDERSFHIRPDLWCFGNSTIVITISRLLTFCQGFLDP